MGTMDIIVNGANWAATTALNATLFGIIGLEFIVAICVLSMNLLKLLETWCCGPDPTVLEAVRIKDEETIKSKKVKPKRRKKKKKKKKQKEGEGIEEDENEEEEEEDEEGADEDEDDIDEDLENDLRGQTTTPGARPSISTKWKLRLAAFLAVMFIGNIIESFVDYVLDQNNVYSSLASFFLSLIFLGIALVAAICLYMFLNKIIVPLLFFLAAAAIALLAGNVSWLTRVYVFLGLAAFVIICAVFIKHSKEGKRIYRICRIWIVEVCLSLIASFVAVYAMIYFLSNNYSTFWVGMNDVKSAMSPNDSPDFDHHIEAVFAVCAADQILFRCLTLISVKLMKYSDD